MENKMNDSDWVLLLGRIKDGECTPFLGAGACPGMPLGRDIAKQLSQQYNFPMKECCEDLAHVSQFFAVKYDPVWIKAKVIEALNPYKPPDQPDEPLAILAELPLPIYITTNYDNFLFQAFESRKKKKANRVLCLWNKILRDFNQDWGFDPNCKPTPENPVIFHLHGHLEVTRSLVLTEDDYLDFLVAISRNQDLIPKRIQQAFAETSLLFLGYRLADIDFRVLFRSLVSFLEISTAVKHISVQLAPGEEHEKEYLEKSFGRQNITVFWGSCQEFAVELRRRWEDFHHGG